jgi:UPF0716 protein FxsA
MNVALLYIIGIILWIWAEIAAFIAIGGELGVILTIIGIFVTAMIGMWLLRTQGRAVIASLQGQVARGEAPVASLAAGVSVLGGAVLMLIPGYLTDAVGVLMFMPVLRTIIGAALLKWVTTRGRFMMRAGAPFGGASFSQQDFGQRGFSQQGSGRAEPGPRKADSDDIIEGEFEEHDRPQRRIDGE